MKKDEIISRSVLPAEWLGLNHTERFLLHDIFNLKRSKGNNLEKGVLVSDGHTVQDLQPLTQSRLLEYCAQTKDQEKELQGLTLFQLLQTAAKKAVKEKQQYANKSKTEKSDEDSGRESSSAETSSNGDEIKDEGNAGQGRRRKSKKNSVPASEN